MPPPPPKASTVSKPFMTEYKLAFKDPTPFLRAGTQPGAKKKAKQLAVALANKEKEKSLALKAAAAAVSTQVLPAFVGCEVQDEIKLGRLHAAAVQSKRKNVWGPPEKERGDLTSLTLPAMLATSAPHPDTFRRRRVLADQNKTTLRYNIISGQEILGEPYSGYKEGRRAVIQTFARIDLITN
ncbi:hypothetical protein HDU98_008804, partial [Podochytrium sp. JEL0797]